MTKLIWDYSDKDMMRAFQSEALLKKEDGTILLGIMYGKAGYVTRIINPNCAFLDKIDIVFYKDAFKKAKKNPKYNTASRNEQKTMELQAACSIIEKRVIKEFEKLEKLV